MAIGARRIRHRRLEIALAVAFAASYAAMFSEERISCPGVIEAFELCHLLPVGCVVARLARAFEGALVRICVAACALAAEAQVGVIEIFYLNSGPACGQDLLSVMAFFAA